MILFMENYHFLQFLFYMSNGDRDGKWAWASRFARKIFKALACSGFSLLPAGKPGQYEIFVRLVHGRFPVLKFTGNNKD